MRLVPAIAWALVLSGCAASAPPIGCEYRTRPPEHWQSLSESDIDQNGCPSIGGIYESAGESNSDIGERFANPIFERSFFNLVEIAAVENNFLLRHAPDEKRVYFEIRSQNGDVIADGLYKIYDYCDEGMLVLESHVAGGSGDSPVSPSFTKTSIGKGQDGSLLVCSCSNATWSKGVFGRETRQSTIWYRFEPAQEYAYENRCALN